jgi:hypothetical protein
MMRCYSNITHDAIWTKNTNDLVSTDFQSQSSILYSCGKARRQIESVFPEFLPGHPPSRFTINEHDAIEGLSKQDVVGIYWWDRGEGRPQRVDHCKERAQTKRGNGIRAFAGDIN